ncbi:MAG: DUF2786 domain-containing protein [Prevotella sp.]|nr:DUF2786 domain-containing protein [Prevotella sp.]
MEKESVISKIRKLLRLQFGAEQIGSMAEACQAANLVKKLLFEYNLSMSDIEDEKAAVNMVESSDMTSIDKYGNRWKIALLHVIASNNLCRVFTRTYNKKMFVIGAEENVVVVKEFYEYLLKVFRRLSIERFNQAQNEAMLEGKRYTEDGERLFMRSYLEGVSSGLQENYDSLKPTSEETALVVCHNQMIDDYLNGSKYKLNDKHRKQRQPRLMGEAYLMGEKDGRNVNLNKQLKNNGSDQMQIEW